MSEQQSLSKKPPADPQPPEVDAAGEEQPTPRAKKSSKRRSQRIDALFIELDKDLVDPDATALPAGEAAPPREPPPPAAVSPPTAVPPPTVVSPHPAPSREDRPRPADQQKPTPQPPEHPAIDTPAGSPGLELRDNAALTPETSDLSPERPKPSPLEGSPADKRPYAPRWSGSLGYQAAPAQGPDAPEDEEILPSNTTLTDFHWESLGQRQLVAGQTDGKYSSLAYALPFGESLDERQAMSAEQRAALLLEIVDDNPERRWSEEELLLVEQVTDQLSLALENARLFDEARTRSEYLAVLNEMSQALSSQLNSQDVIETVYRYTARLVDATNFYLALYHEDTQEVSFPLATEDNQRVQWRARPVGSGLTEYILRTRQPVLIQEDVSAWIVDRLQLEVHGREAESWLGVPMIFGDQVIGVIAVQSFEHFQVFDETDRDLLNSVASQAAVALSNARLFEQTQDALSAVEASERYQKGVAQAVAVLTERGIAALSDVLKILGEAAQASRAYYIETQVDARGAYWRLITEWQAPGVQPQLGNPTLRRLSTRFLAPWLENLRAQGYIAARRNELPPEQKEFLDSLGTQSILQFAVPGRHEDPGCIGFEQVDYERAWGEDEISALQTAAAALANTLAREHLFTQVQLNLAETEALYQASARLNSAATYDDILQVLRQHTILGHLNASSITLNVFDQNWQYRSGGELGKRPEWLIPLARWSAKDQEGLPADRQPLGSWLTIETLLQPERPTIITDVETDARIDEAGRKIYLQQVNAKSLLFVPLNVAGQWIGHIIAVYRQKTGFPEQETRRLTSLAGQSAVGVQNLQSIDLATRRAQEAQQRSEQLALINRVVAAVAGSLDLQTSLQAIVDEIGQALSVQTGIAILNDDQRALTVMANYSPLPDAPSVVGLQIPIEGNAPTQQVIDTRQPLVIADPQNDPIMAPMQDVMRLRRVQALAILPVISSNRILGTLGLDIVEPGRAFTQEELELAQTLVLQAAAALENARLYELAQQAVEEIREAERLKSQFLANMSHELRTPLNSIIGFSRVILKGIDGPINELQQQDLTAIYNSGQHLLGLINDVLDLSKIEAGKMELAFEENVNLADIIKGVMSTTVGLVKDKPVELIQDIDPATPLLRADAMKIRQVLLNLLSNAAKFTEEGSITVSTETLAGPQGKEEVLVSVTDTGPGIAPEDQKKLFQPFSQVDGSLTRKTGGSGLGLSICQHLIQMHGGRIGLRSKVGSGSTFFFSLPIQAVEGGIGPFATTRPELPDLEAAQLHSPENLGITIPEAETPASDKQTGFQGLVEAQKRPTRPLSSAAVFGQGLILAIDPDHQVIDFYRRYLSNHGYTVIAVTELDQAVTVASGIYPSLITLDISMQSTKETRTGRLDGWQVLNALKTTPETKNIPVVICSLLDERQKAFDLGADDYLVKPILEHDLVAAIRRLRGGKASAGTTPGNDSE